MTNPLLVSLVIVSRDRPEGLRRLISSLRFQTHSDFEVITVSNYADRSLLKDLPGAEDVKWIHFDEANISAARNIGLSHAAGEVVAFCDDDAVPEPFWLERLTEPFSDPEIGISGGFVRGRNGIDFQWKATKSDLNGDDSTLTLEDEVKAQIFDFDGSSFAKVQGTNCAFRRSALDAIGGFDEAYRFFMDETDVSLSLAKAGWKTAIVPLAEVQHGFEESAERTAARVPRSLSNIGASKARFLSKHGSRDTTSSIEKLRQEQLARAHRLMVAGFLEPRDVPRLMETFEQGLKVSGFDPTDRYNPVETPKFAPFFATRNDTPKAYTAAFGNIATAKRLSRLAMELTKKGGVVTIFRYTYTALFHKRFFDVRGFWVQSGGQFGRSERTAFISKLWSSKIRTFHEVDNLQKQRPITDVYSIRIFLISASKLTKK